LIFNNDLSYVVEVDPQFQVEIELREFAGVFAAQPVQRTPLNLGDSGSIALLYH
jgi:hypothetical protein